MAKTIDDNFRDWESNFFGYGYGTGESHTLLALKSFFALCKPVYNPDDPPGYRYEDLEAELTPAVAWLLINTLAGHADMIEYGTSPRYGWLTVRGWEMWRYLTGNNVDELYAIATSGTENDIQCFPDLCQCSLRGWPNCDNPFWRKGF